MLIKFRNYCSTGWSLFTKVWLELSLIVHHIKASLTHHYLSSNEHLFGMKKHDYLNAIDSTRMVKFV